MLDREKRADSPRNLNSNMYIQFFRRQNPRIGIGMRRRKQLDRRFAGHAYNETHILTRTRRRRDSDRVLLVTLIVSTAVIDPHVSLTSLPYPADLIDSRSPLRTEMETHAWNVTEALTSL